MTAADDAAIRAATATPTERVVVEASMGQRFRKFSEVPNLTPFGCER